jgi:uncharacterized protein YdgA (DUF945 family)
LHASIGASAIVEQGFNVRKSIVALFIVLALIVFISPAIVGRLAERSMDENLEWATLENPDVVVTSQGFDRGWFSSEGRHRIEVHKGQLHDILLAFGDGNVSSAELPALIITTHLDHGLIPVSSMLRDGGSLVPGLGSAISTIAVELGGGEIVDLPGIINSTVGLTGELKSHYSLAAGSREVSDTIAEWGAVDIKINTSPTSGNMSYSGLIESIEINSDSDFLEIEAIEFSGSQKQSPFGYAIGNIDFVLGTMSFETPNGSGATIGPLSVTGSSSVDGDRINGNSVVSLESRSSQQGPSPLGFNSITVDVRFVGLDGIAIGKLKRSIEAAQAMGGTAPQYAEAEEDALALLAAGFELHVNQFDIAMPQGLVTSKLKFVVEESDADNFDWSSALLTMDASADLRVPNALVELAVLMTPEVNTAIAMGVLKKNGDFYEMEAAYKKGLLTINGAPMAIPLPGTY